MSGKLFLICPTDFIEQTLKNQFESECFFYNALGLNFHWDNDTVNAILCLVNKYSIDDIVFISDFRNAFYKNCLEEKKELNTCDSVLKLSQTLKSIKPQFYFSKSIDEKVKVIASKHLCEQEYKLKKMLSENIHYKISALLFDRKTDSFLHPSYSSLGFDIQLN